MGVSDLTHQERCRIHQLEIRSPLASKVWSCYTHASFEWTVRDLMAMSGMSYASVYTGLIVLQDKGLVERTQNEEQRFVYRRTSYAVGRHPC